MALWKRERSSSSSGREIEIWRGGRIRGARKKKSTGRERRRMRAGISGEEVEEIMAMVADESFFSLRVIRGYLRGVMRFRGEICGIPWWWR